MPSSLPTRLPLRSISLPGGPRVAPRLETGTALPEGSRFATLIDDGWGTADPAPELAVARTDPS